MNQPIMRLYGVVVLLFALLVVFTSRWTVFDSQALQNNTLNKRTLIDEERIKRGRILADDGTVLARSIPARGGIWNRAYPTGALFSQAVGYSNLAFGEAAGLELAYGSQLRGVQTGLKSIFGQLSSNPVGDDLYTTLDPPAQRLAAQLLAGRAGAVVALTPRTGAIKVMYSNPSYDDNNPTAALRGLNGQTVFDRALQAAYPPGSTFKTVTATAALDTGRFTPDSVFNGDSPKTVSGVPLENDGNTSYGQVTLTKALTDSINTVFGPLGVTLGRSTMEDYMKRFGFYSTPPLDYPPGELAPSGEWSAPPHRHLLLPTSDQVDLGRMAIGQDKLGVTPMQMAMVAATVANGGTLMAPHFGSRVVNQVGQTVQTIKPTAVDQVMQSSSAQALTQMMTKVVEEGTGQAANLQGIQVAGKTGTASVGIPGANLTQPWFIGFAPVSDPQVAVAVTVERTQGGFGGTVAAPIAAQIIKLLLQEHR
jgi:peptidoglycan glycosyltransferase